MGQTIRCRRCGKKMTSHRVDDYKMKFSCACGFSEFRPAPSVSRAINPNLSKDNLLPIRVDDKGSFYFEHQRADREKMEIISLEEISMLASSDYDLGEVLKAVAEKTANRLGVDICSIYLWDGEHLVLRGTFGLAQKAVGQAKLKIGEGITGSAVKERAPLLIEDISKDERYHYFQETKEEQYSIKTMYSYPIFAGADSASSEPVGVLNAQTTSIKEFKEDEIYFVSVVANLILGAVKMRKKP